MNDLIEWQDDPDGRSATRNLPDGSRAEISADGKDWTLTIQGKPQRGKGANRLDSKQAVFLAYQAWVMERWFTTGRSEAGGRFVCKLRDR